MNGASPRSMTGFGEAERPLDPGRIRVEIRTVNHRYLNLQLRMPPGFEGAQAAVEGILRDHFARGHVTVTLSVEAGSGGPALEVDAERARGYVDALRSLKDDLGLPGEIGVGVLPWFRELFREPDVRIAHSDLPEGVLVGLVGEAAREVVAMREEEGSRLARDLEGRLDAMERELESVKARAPERLVAERDRLRKAIGDLLNGETPVDEERLAREVAHLAERWDIHEEIVRLRSHLTMFRETLRTEGGEARGKRFGFIAQEILREVNTIGSKANDAEIARRVVLLKEEVERLREQLENVE